MEQTEKKVKAKGVSLWAQMFAAVWIGGWHAAQFVRDIMAGRPIDYDAIVFSGVSIAACFVPVYFNLIMDKVKAIKFGGAE